jgi:hypothetical protein
VCGYAPTILDDFEVGLSMKDGCNRAGNPTLEDQGAVLNRSDIHS